MNRLRDARRVAPLCVLLAASALVALPAWGKTSPPAVPQPGLACHEPFTDHDYDPAPDDLDRDGDGWTTAPAGDGRFDCDDANPFVHPGAAEACDGFDGDCDGYDGVDADGDGADGPGARRDTCGLDCLPHTGDEDCDDADPDVHGGAGEVSPGLDDDCDGLTDEPSGGTPVATWSELQAALVGGGLIELPAGTLSLQAPIVVPSGTALVGHGHDERLGAVSTLRCGDAGFVDEGGSPCVTLEPGAQLQGVMIESGTAMPPTGPGLTITSGPGAVELARVRVQSFPSDGIRIDLQADDAGPTLAVRMTDVVSIGHDGSLSPAHGVHVRLLDASLALLPDGPTRLALEVTHLRTGNHDGSGLVFSQQEPTDNGIDYVVEASFVGLEAAWNGRHGVEVAVDVPFGALRQPTTQLTLGFEHSWTRDAGWDGWRFEASGPGASIDASLQSTAALGAGFQGSQPDALPGVGYRFVDSDDGALSAAVASSFTTRTAGPGFSWEAAGAPSAELLLVAAEDSSDLPETAFDPSVSTWNGTTSTDLALEAYVSGVPLDSDGLDLRHRHRDGVPSSPLAGGSPADAPGGLRRPIGPFPSLPDEDCDGFVVSAGDCAPDDAAVYPGAEELCDGLDGDCIEAVEAWTEDPAFDPFRWGAAASDEFDGDSDGWFHCGEPGPEIDCDDADASIHPGQLDTACDGVDTDCDEVDERDQDDDGWVDCAGLGGPTIDHPDSPVGAGDCDDADAAVHPEAEEACDGFDSDCSHGGGARPDDEPDSDGDGWNACAFCPDGACDCDDSAGDVHPAAVEVCQDSIADEVDENCDGSTTEGLGDRDGDGVADCHDFDRASGWLVQCNQGATRGGGAALLALLLGLARRGGRSRTRRRAPPIARAATLALAIAALPSAASAGEDTGEEGAAQAAEPPTDEDDAEPPADTDAEPPALTDAQRSAIAEAAVSAAEAHRQHCADAGVDEVASFADAFEHVSPVLKAVDDLQTQTGSPLLLYWRGLLTECLGKPKLAVADYQAFVQALGDDPDYASQVREARKRLRRAEADVPVRGGAPGSLRAFQRRFPLLRVAIGAGVQLTFVDDAPPFTYAQFPVDVGLRLIGPLNLAILARPGISSPARDHAGEDLVQRDERSVLLPFGGGLLLRTRWPASPTLLTAVTVAHNGVGTHEDWAPGWGAGLLLGVGGEFELGRSPLQLKPTLEANVLVGQLFVRAQLSLGFAVRARKG